MNKLKRTISILLCLLMLMGCFPANVLANEAEVPKVILWPGLAGECEMEVGAEYYREGNAFYKIEEGNESKEAVAGLKDNGDGTYTVFCNVKISVQYGDNAAKKYNGLNGNQYTLVLVEDGVVEFSSGVYFAVLDSCTVKYAGEDYVTEIPEDVDDRFLFVAPSEDTPFQDILMISSINGEGNVKLANGKSIVVGSSFPYVKYTANSDGLYVSANGAKLDKAGETVTVDIIDGDGNLLLSGSKVTLDSYEVHGEGSASVAVYALNDLAVRLDFSGEATADMKATIVEKESDSAEAKTATVSVTNATYFRINPEDYMAAGAGDEGGTLDVQIGGDDYSCTMMPGKYVALVFNEETNEYELDVDSYSEFITNKKVGYNGKEYEAGTYFVGELVTDAGTVVHILNPDGNDHICDVEHTEGTACVLEMISECNIGSDGKCVYCSKQYAASVTVGGVTTYYEDFDSAVTDASASDEATITLYVDVDYTTKTEGFRYLVINTYDTDNSCYNKLTIDLNGHEIKGGDYGILIEGADVTIEDSSADGTGKITATTNSNAGNGINIRYGSLTVNSGNITGYIGIMGGSQSDVTVNGGKIEGFGQYAVLSSGNTVINGGTIQNSDDDTLIRVESGYLTVTGGTFKMFYEGNNYNEAISAGPVVKEINIYGGTFDIDMCTISTPYEDNHGITIALDKEGNDPSFPQGIRAYGTTLDTLLVGDVSFWQGEKMINLDGTETELEGNISVKATCQHPIGKINAETGICADCQTQYEAKFVVDDVATYELNFFNAMDDLTTDASAEKAVVTLYKDVEVDPESGIWFRGAGVKDITINLSGHKISHPEGSAIGVPMFVASGGEKFTVNGEGSIVAGANAFSFEGGTLIIDGVDITGTAGYTSVSLVKGELELNDVKITSNINRPLYIDTEVTAELNNCIVTGAGYTDIYGTMNAVNTEFTSTEGTAIEVEEGGKVTLTGCTITGDGDDIRFCSGAESLTIGDGTAFPYGMNLSIRDESVTLKDFIAKGYAIYDQDGKVYDIADEEAMKNAYCIVKAMVIGKENVSLEYTDVTYDGNVHIPSVTVTVGGITLAESLYEVICDENSSVGTYGVTVSGKGVVTGEGVVYYNIMPDTTALEGITTENVTTENEDAIREILDSIKNADTANADEETKKQLQETVDKCEELLGVIEDTQEKAQSAGEILENLTPENVKPGDEEAVNAAIEVLEELIGSGNITEAEKTELENAKKEAEELLKAIEEKVLEAYKAEAVETINGYVDLNDYREDHKAAVNAIIAEAKNKLEAAQTQAEVDAIVADTKSKIDEIKTDEELKAEELAVSKKEASEAVENIVDLNDYRVEQQAEIKAIIDESKAKIEAAKTPEEVSQIVAETKTKIDAVKTDEELTAEEFILGDVNGDGEVNALDATQILRYANGKTSALTGVEKDSPLYKAADVNADGEINALDATQILRYSNQKSSVFDKIAQ